MGNTIQRCWSMMERLICEILSPLWLLCKLCIQDVPVQSCILYWNVLVCCPSTVWETSSHFGKVLFASFCPCYKLHSTLDVFFFVPFVAIIEFRDRTLFAEANSFMLWMASRGAVLLATLFVLESTLWPGIGTDGQWNSAKRVAKNTHLKVTTRMIPPHLRVYL